MNEHFDLFHDRIKLTIEQRNDVQKKYDGVSRSLYSEFYDGDYNERTRLIIGSHGKKTETRYPIGDVDLIFKISKEDLDRYQSYEGNGPAALLAQAKKRLGQTYSTSEAPKSWGKVVLVTFPEGKHNVEVMPCYENDDGTFTIPNTENGGSWDNFNPRAEMKMVQESNDITGLTRQMVKFIKRWRTECNASIKSYQIEFFCISYLDNAYQESMAWSEIIEGFFTWLELQSDDIKDADLSKVTTAKNRAQKARDHEISDNYDDACNEYRKIFGDVFPVYDADLDAVIVLQKQYPSPVEEFIEDTFPVRINPAYQLQIKATVSNNKGFRDHPLPAFVKRFGNLLKNMSLLFEVTSNISDEVQYHWKVRNFYQEAQNIDGGRGLRGKIEPDCGSSKKKESTLYKGTHYVECYAIVGGICVAKLRRFVPIGATA